MNSHLTNQIKGCYYAIMLISKYYNFDYVNKLFLSIFFYFIYNNKFLFRKIK